MPRTAWKVRYADGREETVSVGRPAELIWFADTFGRDPAEDGLAAYADACRLIHRALGTDAPPFELWVETLEEVETADEVAGQLREAIEGATGKRDQADDDEEGMSPAGPPEERAPAPAAMPGAPG